MRIGRRTGARLLVAAAACVATLALSAPMASADNSKCDPNRFCLFQNENYGPLRFMATPPDAKHTRVIPDLGSLDDNTKSMINNTNFEVILYADHGCGGGDTYIAKPHSVDTTFANNHFNKRTSCIVINP